MEGPFKNVQPDKNSKGEIRTGFSNLKKIGLAGIAALLFNNAVTGQELKGLSNFSKPKKKTEYQAKDSVDYVKRVELYNDSLKAHKWGVENRINKQISFESPSETQEAKEKYLDQHLAIPGDSTTPVRKDKKEKYGVHYAGIYDGANDRTPSGKMYYEPYFKKPTQPIAPLAEQDFYKSAQPKPDEDRIEKKDTLPAASHQESINSLHKLSSNFHHLNLIEVYKRDESGNYKFDHYEDQKGVNMGSDYNNPYINKK